MSEFSRSCLLRDLISKSELSSHDPMSEFSRFCLLRDLISKSELSSHDPMSEFSRSCLLRDLISKSGLSSHDPMSEFSRFCLLRDLISKSELSSHDPMSEFSRFYLLRDLISKSELSSHDLQEGHHPQGVQELQRPGPGPRCPRPAQARLLPRCLRALRPLRVQDDRAHLQGRQGDWWQEARVPHGAQVQRGRRGGLR